MQFDFATSSRIIFHPNAAHGIPDLAKNLGSRPCLVTGSNPDKSQQLISALSAVMEPPLVIPTTGEPDTHGIAEASTKARNHGCDHVIAIGGGSAMDAGKAIAALITNSDDIYDYLEVIGKGRPLSHPPVPLITVPTTAGTGSEVTTNAVLLSPPHGVKVSLRSTKMIADIAIIDPELMKSMPPAITAATGMDALTQLIEAFVSNAANPITDALCREGILRISTALERAYTHGDDIEARSDMALASLFSGIALANAKLGAVHGFAAPLGGEFHIPHGVACAILLPHVMEANVNAVRSMPNAKAYGDRFVEIGQILTNAPNATAKDGINWVKKVCEVLQIPHLSTFGVEDKHLVGIAAKARDASSMKGNPVQLEDDDLMGILKSSL